MNTSALELIEMASGPAPTATLIVLHGLGADGHDFVPVVQAMDLTGIGDMRCVLPSAPHMPVSMNGGYEMRSWYDIRVTPTGRVEDEAGLRASQAAIDALIEREISRGIAPERIVLMGFSQGCAMTLMVGLRQSHRLAGLIGLSGYLPLPEATATERHPANQHTPIFLAHGTEDHVVAPARGLMARERLQAWGYPVQWHAYPMAHEVCAEEIEQVGSFLRQVLAA
ncbi:alpha/beta hydrolase [Aquabacterium lacunae]|uniref:Alpha/beta hydrolase n=1 Tax=Aquabacterium lacunae TaxID=2528630 RepID=A0A4V2JG21_9BURK|nr:alpha/beta hydrolase [Aquabacterium lacunae]TBO33996.1 alpha/beta hydrolase [Aquabacterium lacunae]